MLNTECNISKIIFAILIPFALFGCQKKEVQKLDQETIPVRAMRVSLREFGQVIEYVGDIKSKDEINIYSKVTGKLYDYAVKEGDRVEKGQTIALVDRDETGLKFELAKVESPIAGVVGKTLLDKGANVLPGATLIGAPPLAVIVNMEQVVVKLNIPESYIPDIKIGLRAEIKVDAYPDQVFSGEVSKVSEVVDLATRSLPIEISIDNYDHRLKSGMFARVKLILGMHAKAPFVLKEAVMGKEPNLYVYKIEGNKALMKKVIIGIQQGPYLEVKEGLKEAELVVIMGQQRLYDNALVNVELAEE